MCNLQTYSLQAMSPRSVCPLSFRHGFCFLPHHSAHSTRLHPLSFSLIKLGRGGLSCKYLELMTNYHMTERNLRNIPTVILAMWIHHMNLHYERSKNPVYGFDITVTSAIQCTHMGMTCAVTVDKRRVTIRYVIRKFFPPPS